MTDKAFSITATATVLNWEWALYFSGNTVISDPDIIELIDRLLELAERRPTRKRVLEKVVDLYGGLLSKLVLGPVCLLKIY